MKKISVAINKKTRLLQELEKDYKIDYFKRQSFLSKLFSKKDLNIDINFFSGILNKELEYELKNSQIIICNSVAQKYYIEEKISKGVENKIKVVYPYCAVKYKYNSRLKDQFKEKYGIAKDKKIIFFTANDILKSGIKYFLKILSNLENKNFEAVVESGYKQIEQLKILLNRQKVDYKIHFIQDYPDKDILFAACDIFLLPTIQKPFSQNILKAMHYNNAVFIPQTNHASEILDPFSLMSKQDDPSTSFKIDALLSNDEELKGVQNQNFIRSCDFSLEGRLNIVKNLIESL